MANPSTLHPLAAKLSHRHPLGPEQVRKITALPHRSTRFERGSFIVREGDRTTNCCLLLSGFVYRHKAAGAGARQILSIHLRGDLCDLHNALFDSADHSVQALTDVTVALIPIEALVALAAGEPSIARAMLADSAADASILYEWLVNVGQRPARQRICHLLCELALRQTAAGICIGPEYEWPMTQEQIGDATGLTSVHVNRTMQALRADRLLQTRGRQIVVADWERVKEAGDFTSAYLHLPDAA